MTNFCSHFIPDYANTNFCSHFIPDYANITTPLRQLTCKDHKFVWTKEYVTAFNHLRDILKHQVTMAYFDPAKQTKLIVDGSRKDGVTSILLQMDQREVYQKIHFDSRATTSAGKNYSQLEIESLALMYGTMKNHMYLFGLPTYTARYRSSTTAPQQMQTLHASTDSAPQAEDTGIQLKSHL